MKDTKWIIVTGGVLSGLGKGVVSASIGRLLVPTYKVVPIKCDGYLNVDPGTMNPVEHGEVFVLDDGGEVDLDFGHYERFLNLHCKSEWNLTSGKIFQALPEFKPVWTAERGAQELFEAYGANDLSLEDFEGPRYKRIERIKYLLDAGLIDANLRWVSPRIIAKPSG